LNAICVANWDLRSNPGAITAMAFAMAVATDSDKFLAVLL
jgi:hypothetical protein